MRVHTLSPTAPCLAPLLPRTAHSVDHLEEGTGAGSATAAAVVTLVHRPHRRP
jgi:hypothetical protein